MLYASLITTLFISHFVFAVQPKLTELLTKQPIDRMRFISQDGKFTYYQNSKGHLLLVTNYDVRPVLKLEKDTHFLLQATEARKRILVQYRNDLHNFHNIMAPWIISTIPYGEEKITQRGEGLGAKLILDDKWISYFIPTEKIIRLQNLEDPDKKHDLPIENPITPFFIPTAYGVSSNFIIYNDLTLQGRMVLKSFNRITRKSKIIFKAEQIATKVEICLLNNELVLGQFPYPGQKTPSSLALYDIQKSSWDIKLKKTLYKSETLDVGNIICQRNNEKPSVLFIKASKKFNELGTAQTNLASIDIKSEKLKMLTQSNEVLHLIDMDGSILIPYRGKAYLAKGQIDLDYDRLEAIDSDEVLKKINESK